MIKRNVLTVEATKLSNSVVVLRSFKTYLLFINNVYKSKQPLSVFSMALPKCQKVVFEIRALKMQISQFSTN